MGYTRAEVMSGQVLEDLITVTSGSAVGKTKTIEALRDHVKSDPRKEFVSGGSIMRRFAKERGMTIERFAAYVREHPEEEYDKKTDAEVAKWGLRNHTVIEGRLPHIFAPCGFKVLLMCPVRVRAKRRHRDFPHLEFQEVLDAIEKRDRDDRKRYEKLYPGCLWPETDFDLVISTETHLPATVAQMIVQGHAEWLQKVGEPISIRG